MAVSVRRRLPIAAARSISSRGHPRRYLRLRYLPSSPKLIAATTTWSGEERCLRRPQRHEHPEDDDADRRHQDQVAVQLHGHLLFPKGLLPSTPRSGLAPDPARDLLRIDTRIAGNCCDSHHNQSNFFCYFAPNICSSRTTGKNMFSTSMSSSKACLWMILRKLGAVQLIKSAADKALELN